MVKQEGVVKQANLAYRRISSRLAISYPDEFLVKHDVGQENSVSR